MKIAFGCDHRGFEIKELILTFLKDKGHEVIDCGTNSNESVDYTDHVLDAAKKVGKQECALGIGACFTGIGSSIAANKVAGVRAALVEDEERAKLTRAHNDANMLILGAGFLQPEKVLKIVEAWLTTEFEGGRHERRVNKIKTYEEGKNS